MKSVFNGFFNFIFVFIFNFYSNQALVEDHASNSRAKKHSTPSRPHADLVKWQGTLLLRPLLRLPMELAPLAIECFECILRYCGDLPPDPELTEVKCVYTILMVITKTSII